MRPNPKRLPGRGWIERLFGALAAYEALEYVVYGAGFLVFAFAIWRTAVPHEPGPAMQKAAQDGHDLGVWMFAGIGAVVLLIGGLLFLGFIREYRRANDGKWG